MRGRRGYRCVLTAVQTGKQYEFESAQEASLWLCRTRTYVNTCYYKGFPIKHKNTGECFTVDYPSVHKQNKKPKDYTIQPCCTCKKFCGGCAWSRDFKPVEGWDAVPTIIHQQWGKEIHSFAILRCPEYEWG